MLLYSDPVKNVNLITLGKVQALFKLRVFTLTSVESRVEAEVSLPPPPPKKKAYEVILC